MGVHSEFSQWTLLFNLHFKTPYHFNLEKPVLLQLLLLDIRLLPGGMEWDGGVIGLGNKYIAHFIIILKFAFNH